MSVHCMTLNSPWYELVKSGEKTLEGRRWTDKTASIKVGDTIQISHHVNKTLPSFNKTVTNIFKFQTFEHGLTQPTFLTRALPTIPTIEEGVEIYKKYVSLQTQLKDGICFIELE